MPQSALGPVRGFATEVADGESLLLRLLRDESGGAVERPVLVKRLAETEGISLAAAKVRVMRALKRRLLALSDDAREVMIPW